MIQSFLSNKVKKKVFLPENAKQEITENWKKQHWKG